MKKSGKPFKEKLRTLGTLPRRGGAEGGTGLCSPVSDGTDAGRAQRCARGGPGRA